MKTKQDREHFYQQIAEAMLQLGTEEALACMARVMSAIAHQQGNHLKLDCDLAIIDVKPKVPLQRH
jgi:hypothetical protein